MFSAERSGNTLIGVVLHCSSTWQEATTLLDYGFARHTWQRYATAGEVEQRIAVAHGMKNTLDLLVKEDILVPLREGEGKEAVQLRVSCPSSIDAPVYAGQQVGSIEVWADGKVLQTVPLVAAESIAKKAYGYFVEKFFREFIAS